MNLTTIATDNLFPIVWWILIVTQQPNVAALHVINTDVLNLVMLNSEVSISMDIQRKSGLRYRSRTQITNMDTHMNMGAAIALYYEKVALQFCGEG